MRRVQLGHQFTTVAAATPAVQNVMRRSSADDERVKLLEITPKGLQTLAAIDEKRAQYQKHFLTSLSNEQKDDLLSVLKKILQSTTG